MMIYVASPHSQQSRVFCQGTSAYFSANLCPGRKNELKTQLDFLYFLVRDFQSGLDDRSHLKGKKRKPLGSIMFTFYSFLEGSQHLHVMAIMKCIGIAYFQYQHRRWHWYSTILAPRSKWFQKGTFTKNKSDFRNWLRTAKITSVVPEAPGSEQHSVLTGFTFNKIWQCNLFTLLNLSPTTKIRLPIPILP